MSKIDVSKCAFYNNGKCNNPNGMACNCCNNAYCYYKELQQLKAENEGLQSLNDFNVQKIETLEAENDELIERLKCNCFDSKSKQNRCTSYKRMAEDYERDLKELQQLKAENDELKEELHKSREYNLAIIKQGHQTMQKLEQIKKENEELKNKLKMQKYKRIVVECGKRSFKNILHKYTLFQQCLDEIEEIAKNGVKDDCGMPLDELSIILKLIKQAKDGNNG